MHKVLEQNFQFLEKAKSCVSKILIVDDEPRTGIPLPGPQDKVTWIAARTAPLYGETGEVNGYMGTISYKSPSA